MPPLLALPLLGGAALYASVGHGGASAYLAIMALAGIDPGAMRPVALVLNVLVAGTATILFVRAGRFSPRLFWPLALASVPAAFAGGALVLPVSAYRQVLGLLLLLAAVPLLRAPRPATAPRRAPILLALAAGGAIGFLAGLTGIGGGVFLTPLLVLGGFADPRVASGVSAPFIVANSCAGLIAQPGALMHLDPALPIWAAAVLAGGLTGSYFGSSRFAPRTVTRVLAAVLLVAALKLFLPV